jgi:hypothetical protein
MTAAGRDTGTNDYVVVRHEHRRCDCLETHVDALAELSTTRTDHAPELFPIRTCSE